jgi:CubicO group peptidase (beta-lactamase class C family)
MSSLLVLGCAHPDEPPPPRRAPEVEPPTPQLPRTEPRASGLDAKALDALVRRATEADSDALVVLVDGKVVVEEYFDRPRAPIEAMSATKSIVALAVGRLVDQRKIPSLDTPVHTFYPEWRQGKKREITVRHLLNHTSGLQNERTTDVEIYPSPDFVKLALAAEVSDDPGTRFAYNNKAVNLMAGVIEQASGKKMDVYIGEAIFAPLGITEYDWTVDETGNPHAMSGLQIHALDFARVGLLVVENGVHRGNTIVSRAFIEQAMQPGTVPGSSRCGLLWWLVPERQTISITEPLVAQWKAAGVEPEFLERVRPLVGQEFERAAFGGAHRKAFPTPEDQELWARNTWKRGLPDVDMLAHGPIVAYRAEGYLGQHLVILPSARVVAVRQKRADGDASKIDAMADFPELVRALASSDAKASGGSVRE